MLRLNVELVRIIRFLTVANNIPLRNIPLAMKQSNIFIQFSIEFSFFLIKIEIYWPIIVYHSLSISLHNQNTCVSFNKIIPYFQKSLESTYFPLDLYSLEIFHFSLTPTWSLSKFQLRLWTTNQRWHQEQWSWKFHKYIWYINWNYSIMNIYWLQCFH